MNSNRGREMTEQDRSDQGPDVGRTLGEEGHMTHRKHATPTPSAEQAQPAEVRPPRRDEKGGTPTEEELADETGTRDEER